MNEPIKFDLVVAGGGFAGTAAALSAARAGLSVLLFDKSNCLGGAAVNCLVNPFMPNDTPTPDHGEPEKHSLSQGIFLEIADALKARGAAEGDPPFLFKEEELKLLLNRMALKAGVRLLFHAVLTGAEKRGDTLCAVTVATRSGPLRLEAAHFIDATGDAALAVLAGCPARLGRAEDGLCQPMTLCFRVANVDLAAFEKARPQIDSLYRRLREEGKIKNPREDVLIFPSLIGGMLHFNSTRVVRRNPVDPFDLTRAEIEAREQVFELFSFLKENVAGFGHSELAATAQEIGVRESRMIDGAYVLTGEDLTACRKFGDSVALGNYDIDIHNPEGTGTSHYYFPRGQYYTIPYRCLVPRGVGNLLVAGRCISVTHEAQASIRILPIVCCLGEAAGAAAALARQTGASFPALDTDALRTRLLRQGAAC